MAAVELTALLLVIDTLFGQHIRHRIVQKLALLIGETGLLFIYTFYHISGLWMIFAYVVMVIGVKWIYRDDINLCILYYVIAFLSVSAVEVIIYIPFAFFWGKMIGDDLAGLLGTLGTLGIVLLIRKKKWIRWGVIHDFVKCRYKLLCYICVAVGTVMLVAVSYFHVVDSMPIYSFLFLVIMIIIVFPVMSQFMKNEIELRERSKFEKPMRDVITRIRQQQHQFDAHLSAIYGMIHSCPEDESLRHMLKEYMSKIKRVDAYYGLILLEDPVLSGFLGVKFAEAENRGINVFSEISVKKMNTNIPLTELIGAFGNLIDNAIEEVESQNLPKKIHLIIEENEAGYQFVISNPIHEVPNAEIRNFGKKGYSTKGTGDERGIGLCDVIDTINRYKGEVLMKKEKKEDADWFTVIVSMLCLDDKKM